MFTRFGMRRSPSTFAADLAGTEVSPLGPERLKPNGEGYLGGMILLGLVLLLLGLVLQIGMLWSVGVIVLIVGCVLMLLGRSGRPVRGRAHYW